MAFWKHSIREKTMQDAQEFSVALILNDMADAKNLSQAFREFGIFPHFYESLDEFWAMANRFKVDLCVVDVSKMSQGPLILKNHPKIENKEISLAFFYSKSNEILVSSTQSVLHLGLIKKENDLVKQLKPIVIRFKEFSRLRDNNLENGKSLERLKKKNYILHQDNSSSYQMNFQRTKFEELKKIYQSLSSQGNQDDVFYKMAYTINKLDQTLKFGIYFLNESFNKLYSPHYDLEKYEMFPALFLGKECHQGLETFAIELAEDVASESLDKNFRTLKIFPRNSQPEVLIIGRYQEEALDFFPWQDLADFFSYELSKAYLSQNHRNTISSNLISHFEALQRFDEIQFHQRPNEFRIISVSLNPLIQNISSSVQNRFFWSDFLKDLLGTISREVHHQIKCVENGAAELLFLLPIDHIEPAFKSLQKVFHDFPFHQYFADSETFLKKMSFEFLFVSPSSQNVILKRKNLDQQLLPQVNGKNIKTPQIASSQVKDKGMVPATQIRSGRSVGATLDQ
jgi:hypothetical protein